MKRILAILLIVWMIVGCCTKQLPIDTHSVRQYKSVTFHADTSYDRAHRDALNRAAGKIWVFTNGRAEVRIIYDLDFNSMGSLETHKNHSQLYTEHPGSTMADIIDARHPKVRVLAEQSWVGAFKAPRIIFIEDRIVVTHFETIAMHEMGHAIGLDDLDDPNSVMSGTEWQMLPPHNEFTDVDLRHCRSKLLCE